ncbi:MAG: T9SS type B sorting domain-containing protein [Flavobacteriales bacterium]|nr:T9SS type B sorting domain-containing protein [Flavobacteriales bacterium]
MNIRLPLFFLCFMASMHLSSQLVINEVCAANYTDHTDNFGEYEDWFEIYNTGAADVDLLGYYLSDDILEPTKFEVTSSVTVPAGGYRVVFASNRNTVSGTNIHTSFKINQKNQEYAVLADPAGTIIDVFWMENPNQTNHSWGRLTDGGATWGVFTNPSPGAANAGGFNGYAATPTIDIASGAHGGPISITVSSPDAGVTLRYGTNGNEPTGASPEVMGPIDVNATEVIHVRAFSDDPMILPSFIETNTYLIAEGHVLPVISISGPQIETLMNGTQIEPIGHFEFFGADGQLKDEARGDFNEHGNDSWAYDQRGIDYITRDQMGYNDEIHHPIFRTKDRPSYQRLIIKAAANDNYPFSPPAGAGAHVIDAYIHSLSQIGDLRMDERSHEPCVMYVNGQYWGLYEVREKVDDLDFTDYYYDQGEGEVDFIKTWGGTWNEYDSGTCYEWDDLVDFITTQDMTDPANYDYVKSVYNTGSLIDYFVLNSYVVTSDWLNWNTGWWRGKDPDGDKKKWRYILWDNDASFGEYINFTGIPDTSPDADPCNPEQIGDPGGQGHVPVLNALLGNEEFYNDYVSRFADLSQTLFSCDVMLSHWDSLITMLEPEMPRQVNRWGGTVAEWQSNADAVRSFIVDRCAAFNDGMLDCYDVEGPYPLMIQIMPPGAGYVEFNSIDVTDSPWEGEYFGNLDVEMEANPYGINVFSHWETNNHVLSDYLVDTAFFTFNQPDTITAWFVNETSDIVLDVEPAGTGSIKFNNTLYSTLPTTVTAPESVPLPMIAVEEDMFWGFDHWELENHTLDPGLLEDTVSIEVDTTDYITAVFVEKENYIIEITVDNPEGGYIIFNGQIYTDFPVTIQLLANETYDIEAILNEHFSFGGWTVDGLTFDGTLEDLTNSFFLDGTGSIVAHFIEDENYEITYDVHPIGTGEIILDGQVIPYYPFTEKYYEPDLERLLEARPSEYFDLDEWTMNHNIPTPDEDSDQITVQLTANDTITAHFVREFYGYYLPNAFTPNGDGFNDIYYVQGHAIDVQFYSFEIYDRQGQLVFETKDIEQGWNGQSTGDSEYYAQDGVYVYRLTVQSVFDNKQEEVFGEILLTR